MIAKPFERKSIFIWNVPAIEGGDPQKIAALLKYHGFNSVMPKCADGVSVQKPGVLSFPLWLGKPNVDKTFVDVMHANDIAVIGWGFNYGTNGDGEGRIAAQQCDALGLDGWVYDVEGNFENYSDCVARAGQCVGTFRKTIVNSVPTALCTWSHFKSPSGGTWHSTSLPRFWAGFVDYFMPMIYWAKLDANSKPVVMNDAQIETYVAGSFDQWRTYVGDKPIVPAGRAYTGDGNVVIPENIVAFDDYAHDLGAKGITYWVLDSAQKIPAVMSVLKALNGQVIPEPDPTPDPLPAVPVSKIISISPQPAKLTDILIETDVNGIKYQQALSYVPVAPPPVTPPATGTNLYRIKDDIEAGIIPNGTRAYLRVGLPSTVRLQGGTGTINLPKAWMDYVKKINVTTKNYNYLVKPDSGWHNQGEENHFEELTFSGNVLDVLRIEGNRAYIRTYFTNETPPTEAIQPREKSLHPLVQMFSIQYRDRLDMSTDGRYCLTLIIANPGEQLWIDTREIVKVG